MGKFIKKQILFLTVIILMSIGMDSKQIVVYANDNYGISVSNSYASLNTEFTNTYEVQLYNYTSQSRSVKVTSGDTSIVQIGGGTGKLPANTYAYTFKFQCKPKSEGVAIVKIQVGNFTQEMLAHVSDGVSLFKDIVQVDSNTVRFRWNSLKGCDGYRIKRSEVGKYNYRTIKTIYGSNRTSATMDFNEWNKPYEYEIVAYKKMKHGVQECYEYNAKPFILRKIGVQLTSLVKSGDSSIKITWKKDADAKGYRLYRSTSENGNYKCIYSTNDGTKTSYINKVQKGITYYYKLKTVYPKFTSQASEIVSKTLPISKKEVQKVITLKEQFSTNPQYSGYPASTDDANYYIENGNVYVVVPGKNQFGIYKLDSSLNQSTYKKVKLSYERWGGCYHGHDGNFYVVVGYNNPGESRSKVVIKVLKYSKNWKHIKTANIKADASNVFEGVVTPFRSGNCSIDMLGSTLYIHTSRLMFVHDDGLNHQSNISFAVNTKTMKAVSAEDTYCSHSFNQYAKFQNGDLYLLDHGDAYPRAIQLTKISNYGKRDEQTLEYGLFQLQGETGENFTGCTVGGMEIGKDNVLVCGTAQPHNMKVQGITGSGYDFGYNVYLIVADKDTGKRSIKWLTSYHPLNGNMEVGNTRMVKIDDNRFGVLYTTRKADESTEVLNYVVVDSEGKIIYKEQHLDMAFSGGTQPVFHKGRIIWMDTVRETVTEVYGTETFTYYTGKKVEKIFSIAALVK